MTQLINEHPQLRQSWEFYQQGKWSEAKEACKQIIDEGSEVAPNAFLLTAMCQLAEGNVEAAVLALDEAEHVLALRVPIAIVRGQCALERAAYSEAQVSFRVALDYQPESAEAWYGLGRALLGLDETQPARAALRQAASLMPEYAAVQFLLGVAALQENDSQEAISAFTTTARLLPDAPEVANNLGLAHQAAGDAKRAEKSYRRAVELNADFAHAWYNLAAVVAENGALSDAQAHYEKALALDASLAEHGKPWDA